MKNRPCILVLTGCYLPGFRGGGPVRTIFHAGRRPRVEAEFLGLLADEGVEPRDDLGIESLAGPPREDGQRLVHRTGGVGALAADEGVVGVRHGAQPRRAGNGPPVRWRRI